MSDFGPPVPNLTQRQTALRGAAFRALLDSGQPVPPDRLAAELGDDLAELTADLRTLAGRGLMRLADGAVVASLGLTLVATNHELDIDGARWHTWCALDALGILGALAADGRISSTNPVIGERFEITVSGGTPSATGPPPVLFMAGQAPVASVIDQWCPLVNFFPSQEVALAWSGQAGVPGSCLDLAVAAPLAAKLWRPLIRSPG
jgi:hypothetical protein